MWYVYTNRHTADHPFRFRDLLALQDEVLALIRPEQGSALLFAELAPTVTFGARQIHVEAEQAKFKEMGLEIISGERGGNETWHGPGQWVCFVLTPLQKFTGDARGVRKAVYQILERVLPVAQSYLPEVSLREGAELGLWSGVGKVASVGIKIRDHYVTSGFALNCIPNSQAFSGISPCGISNALPDFIFRESVSVVKQESEFAQIPSRILEQFIKSGK